MSRQKAVQRPHTTPLDSYYMGCKVLQKYSDSPPPSLASLFRGRCRLRIARESAAGFVFFFLSHPPEDHRGVRRHDEVSSIDQTDTCCLGIISLKFHSVSLKDPGSGMRRARFGIVPAIEAPFAAYCI